MKIAKILLLVSLFFSLTQFIVGQDRFTKIETDLELFRAKNPLLDSKVDISVSDLTINEFLRGVAKSNGLNISVDNELKVLVTNSFKDVSVGDLLIFLCRQYNLDLKVQGSIIHLSAYKVDESLLPVKKRAIEVKSFKDKGLLTIDVKDEPLSEVCRAVISETGINVIPDMQVRNQLVSGYVSQMPVDEALKEFLLANNLNPLKDQSGTWKVNGLVVDDSKTVKGATSSASNVDFATNKKELQGFVEIVGGKNPLISVKAIDAPISGLLKYVSDSLKINYAFVGKLEDKVTINMTLQSYDDFIGKILRGANYNFKKERDVYYFVNNKAPEFNIDKLIALQNRTTDKIIANIPEGLKRGVTIVEYPELNSLFLSGEKESVLRLHEFILEIDQVIPVILIEVLIVDVKKNKGVTTGINAGMGKNPHKSTQSFMPGVDYQFSPEQLNSMVQKFSSFGWVNLGKVSPDFYLSIKAMEENGYLYVRSTPKLSTLNGSKATLSSGETKYYKEEQSNYYGSQNPALTNSYTWKPLNADMSLSILPMVSGDDQVTLDIEVQQSEFTSREFDNSPPGSISRNFKSLIRVKNQEMVLLGGLDRMTSKDTGSGIPILARIPIIKWFFSSRTKATEDNKLSVFIQPTIIY